MSWAWVLVAAAGCFATKLLGYLVPRTWLENPTVARTMGGVTIGVLAALVGLNTVVTGSALAFDARVAALLVALAALWLRLPFIIVVILGAAAAAAARLLGAA